MLRAFHFNLSALAWVALLVGLFLVYNTVAVSVIARREEIGTLRALGTPRRTVLGLFLAEAAVLGGVGSMLGAGGGLAAGARRRAADLDHGEHAVRGEHDFRVPPLITGAMPRSRWSLGCCCRSLAAIPPALEASRVTPLAALRGSNRIEARYRSRRAISPQAASCSPSRRVLSRLGPVDGLPLFGFAAAVAVVFGVACLVPSGALRALPHRRPAARPHLRHRGRARAREPLGRHPAPGRLGCGAGGGALDDGRDRRDDRQLPRDRRLLGGPDAPGGLVHRDRADVRASRAQSTISPELEAAVSAHPAVDAVDRFRSVESRVRGTPHGARVGRLPRAPPPRSPAVQGAPRRSRRGRRR